MLRVALCSIYVKLENVHTNLTFIHSHATVKLQTEYMPMSSLRFVIYGLEPHMGVFGPFTIHLSQEDALTYIVESGRDDLLKVTAEQYFICLCKELSPISGTPFDILWATCRWELVDLDDDLLCQGESSTPFLRDDNPWLKQIILK